MHTLRMCIQEDSGSSYCLIYTLHSRTMQLLGILVDESHISAEAPNNQEQSGIPTTLITHIATSHKPTCNKTYRV